LYMYDEWPPADIDHINQIKTDNRAENIRVVSNKENHQNMPTQKNSTSGFTGIHWLKDKGRFLAHIKVNGKQIRLGTFKALSDAVLARIKAEVTYGFHKNHGGYSA